MLTYAVCYVDDPSKLHELELEFLNDPANAHLFEETEPTPDPEPRPAPAKKQSGSKRAAKGGDGAAATQRKRKKKEPELVCTVYTQIF